MSDDALTTEKLRKIKDDLEGKIPGCEEIIVGAIVSLKSGGSEMTVREIKEDGMVHCQWFEFQSSMSLTPFGGGGGQHLTGMNFPIEMLKIVR